ncbi:MAG: ROK family protein [Gemmataceae bacterium]|nr:ROK family protein [Gemmataceae bacterium]
MARALGIEIGGTKLQLGIGSGDGTFTAFRRDRIDPAAGGERIRRQIIESKKHFEADRIDAVGFGFGGPVDDATRRTITSHQVPGWDDFPLAQWAEDLWGVPATLGNDADCAALAEATLGAGRGFDPVFYVTIGSGIGGGLVQHGRVARGTGRGAAEIGHLRINGQTLENQCSGWAIQRRFGRPAEELAATPEGRAILAGAWEPLADALCHVIALLCPARIVIGGGVSLLGEVLFEPLRKQVAEKLFRPFAGLTEIVPAALGEEVVVHGAIGMAMKTSNRNC